MDPFEIERMLQARRVAASQFRYGGSRAVKRMFGGGAGRAARALTLGHPVGRVLAAAATAGPPIVAGIADVIRRKRAKRAGEAAERVGHGGGPAGYPKRRGRD